MKDKTEDFLNFLSGLYKKRSSLSVIVSLSFTSIAIICMTFTSFSLYTRYAANVKKMVMEDNKQVIDQVSINLNTYIRNMMSISDTMYYNVIKNKDLSFETIDEEMALLYEMNNDNLISIACFDKGGGLVAATPIAILKDNADVINQDWYINANKKIENLHFSTPHVQRLFDDENYRYYWVVSLSRAVELTYDGESERGILLVDMNFNDIEQMFKKVNSKADSYVYLMNNNGEILYHPKQKLIECRLYKENNIKASAYEDGSYIEKYQGQDRVVVVKTVGYTGWRIVSITPSSAFNMNLSQFKWFTVLIFLVGVLVIVICNTFISSRITTPIKKLEASIKEIDNGNLDLNIYIGGSQEIKHLGSTIKVMVWKMKNLMDDIVKEQEEKRKSELDALQSQINPHFLYNTLDSIVWMIEDEQYKGAISMVTSLASLFRISLSKGRNIISIKDEIAHAQNYINIQKVRYKNKFTTRINVDENIFNCSTIKLIIQPLIENAIYYGVEYMDGEGEIEINGYEKNGEIFIEVSDNGMGIPKEEIESLLNGKKRERKRGSGIGLRNVDQRIKLYFGEQYGLSIVSELDEGTTVTIHLPKIIYQAQEG